MHTPDDLPREFPERQLLFRATVAVLDLLFSVGNSVVLPPVVPWEPPDLRESDVCPQLPDVRGLATGERIRPPVSSTRYEFVRPYQEYNRRVARTALALEPLEDALLVAGLPPEDLNHWRQHRAVAAELLRQPDGVTVASPDLWYVYDVGYMGVYSLGTGLQEERIQAQMSRCRDALGRLRRAVQRIEWTVSPQAILDRLHVSEDRKEAVLDGEVFPSLLPKSEGILLYQLRLGAGEWVSSRRIAKLERLVEFKVNRAHTTLKRKQPRLGAIINSEAGEGSRIVLPLAPKSTV